MRCTGREAPFPKKERKKKKEKERKKERKKEERKINPIDWNTLTEDIKRWSQTTCRKSVMICKSTLKKFSERI